MDNTMPGLSGVAVADESVAKVPISKFSERSAPPVICNTWVVTRPFTVTLPFGATRSLSVPDHKRATPPDAYHPHRSPLVGKATGSTVSRLLNEYPAAGPPA